MDAVRSKMGLGRRGARFQEEGKQGRLPDLLYADNLVLCGESGRPEGNGGTFC